MANNVFVSEEDDYSVLPAILEEVHFISGESTLVTPTPKSIHLPNGKGNYSPSSSHNMNEYHVRTYFTACNSKESAMLSTTGVTHPPHPNIWEIYGPATINQNQEQLDNTSTLDSDNENNCIAIFSNELEYGKVVSQLNTVFDESDDYLYTEIKSITDHYYISGIIEFNLKYTNGDTSWNPVSLVKDENPHAVAYYVVRNDLGLISNEIHQHWAREFMRALKRTI